MSETRSLDDNLLEIFRTIFEDGVLLSVRSLDKEHGVLRNEFRWQKESNQDMPETDELIPIQGTISGRAISRKEAVYVPEIDKEPLFYPRGAAYVAAGYVSMMAVPLFDFNSEVIGVVQVYTNIRHRQFNKKEERTIQAVCKMMEHMILSRQLEEKKLETQLLKQTQLHAREVNHHIKNKVAPMGGFARRMLKMIRKHILKKRRKYGASWKTVKYAYMQSSNGRSFKYLTLIIRAAKKLEDALKDVLNFGSSELHTERTELAEFLRRIVERPDRQPDSIGITMDQRSSGDVFVNIDRRKMEIVVQELLRNAGKAAEKSGSKNSLACRLFRHTKHEQNSVCFEVVNDGEIPLEIRNSIYDPFVTTDRQCGTGLGLSMAKLAVEQHGGTIRVESSGGKTSAKICLPIVN